MKNTKNKIPESEVDILSMQELNNPDIKINTKEFIVSISSKASLSDELSALVIKLRNRGYCVQYSLF